MNNLELVIILLPIIFMVHDFEEIIFFKPWLKKNKEYLEERFPLLAKFMIPKLETLTTGGFTLAVCEEFILLSLITYYSLYFGFIQFWMAAFMAFFVHLVIHIIQWFFVRRYIPAIFSSFLALPYCIYGLSQIRQFGYFSDISILLWTLTGVIVMGINLVFAHWLGNLFSKWEYKKGLQG